MHCILVARCALSSASTGTHGTYFAPTLSNHRSAARCAHTAAQPRRGRCHGQPHTARTTPTHGSACCGRLLNCTALLKASWWCVGTTQVVSYKCASRQFQLPSNHAKQ